MSIDWTKHAECRMRALGTDAEYAPCNADRAEMIAEGKRLEAESARLREALRHALSLCLQLRRKGETLMQVLPDGSVKPVFPMTDAIWNEAVEACAKYMDRFVCVLASDVQNTKVLVTSQEPPFQNAQDELRKLKLETK